jgi:hypothetical protein
MENKKKHIRSGLIALFASYMAVSFITGEVDTTAWTWYSRLWMLLLSFFAYSSILSVTK